MTLIVALFYLQGYWLRAIHHIKIDDDLLEATAFQTSYSVPL
jgi:hypothetical protein